MNDLVFVMYNLKLEDRQRRKVINTTIEDLPSDNKWIVDQEDNALNEDLLNIFSTTKGKEIAEDDSVEEIDAFDAIDIDAVEAEMGVDTAKDLALEDMDVNISESDHDIDSNEEDENGDDGDGNGEDNGCSNDNKGVDDLF